MKVPELRPPPTHRETFRRDRYRRIPHGDGAYVLATFDGTVLYVGLTNDLRRRFQQHLDSHEKTGPTAHGRATFFHWLEHGAPHAIERGWINQHWNAEGARPVLNKLDPPTHS